MVVRDRLRVCVCTVVHHAEDARILHRQIRALLAAGHEVTYIAPFSASGAAPWPELTGVDVPRARGRRRLRALRHVRRALSRHARDADVLLLHDPELLLLLPFIRRRPPTVWDVHEDTAAALSGKAWLPGFLAALLRRPVRWAERLAERRLRLLLAEEGYRPRFRIEHPIVPNTTHVPAQSPPPPGADRVVYVGHLSTARGADDLLALAAALVPHGIRTDLVGGADPKLGERLRAAQRDGVLRWHGYQSNDAALALVEGALAGLSLLHDEPNYRHSVPTKIIEYMARGVPVVTTPLPAARAIVERDECGIVVPFGDPSAVLAAVLRLRDDPDLRRTFGTAGHRAARLRYHWPDQAKLFVAQLQEWSGVPAETSPGPHQS
ncbi:putative glycosyl transferase [Actinomadura rubteroloni]|uniref:Putative glycosyl transferase n=1 Tax=Actinomadura rubteroloni TaxID=1926885 RepID=A0A2P4UL39_9ACTN|nr:glycosyltransferase [Actinomadura rubteroloni]POM25768.1 putative glycosyl transferase [Actinomadura rubteroloni]